MLLVPGLPSVLPLLSEQVLPWALPLLLVPGLLWALPLLSEQVLPLVQPELLLVLLLEQAFLSALHT